MSDSPGSERTACQDDDGHEARARWSKADQIKINASKVSRPQLPGHTLHDAHNLNPVLAQRAEASYSSTIFVYQFPHLLILSWYLPPHQSRQAVLRGTVLILHSNKEFLLRFLPRDDDEHMRY